MSQAHVEGIIGRLVTDDQWRSRYRSAPAHILDGLAADAGLEVTTIERDALASLPVAALDALARLIDPRLQRLGVRR